MTPVTQTILDDYKGNCFASCVASLLDLPLNEVPNFVECASMHTAARDWLEARGYLLFRLHFADLSELARTYFETGYYPLHCILSGISPRTRADGGEKHHAVVGTTHGYGVKIVHDPHPSRAGLAPHGGRWVYFLFKR